MKKLILSFFVFFLVSGATSQDSFIVRGVVNDRTSYGSQVYLTNMSHQVVDSSRVSPTGFFEFEGDASTFQMLNVDIPSAEGISFVNESGIIHIRYKGGVARLSGTPLNDALQKYYNWKSYVLDKGLPNQEQPTVEVYDSLCKAGYGRANRVARSLFEANKDNFVGALTLMYWMNALLLPSAEVEKLMETAGDVVRQDSTIHQELTRRRREIATAVGNSFVDFEGTDTLGSKLSLSDFVGHGKWILVNFWAAWYPRNLMDMAELTTLKHELERSDFEIVGVHVWDLRENALDAIANIKMPWRNIIVHYDVDQEDPATSAYGINEISTLILIAPTGKIALRGKQFTFEDIRRLVTATK